MADLERYLKEFAKVADAWFEERPFIWEGHEFFRKFFTVRNLRRLEWEDVQKLGGNIHALAVHGMARKRAVGRPNYPIEQYRKSLHFIAHGKGTVEERMRAFATDKAHTNKYLGESSISELFGHLNADDYVFYNSRDKKAAEFLGLAPVFARGDDIAAKFEKFNRAIRPIFGAYEEIVGAYEDVPLGLQIDQFLSWVFVTYVTKEDARRGRQVWLMGTGESGSQWNFFKDSSVIALGSGELEDLQSYKNADEIRARIVETRPDVPNPFHDVKACWDFSRNVKKGDLVFAKIGRQRIVGYGEVTGDYRFDERRSDYRNLIPVEWKGTGSWTKTGKLLVTKTLTNITNRPKLVAELSTLVGLDGEDPEETPNYWWLNCNPTMWRILEWKPGESQFYTTHNEAGNKRRVYENFLQAQVGDMVIGYETKPSKRVTSLLKITKGVHKKNEKEIFEFEVVRHFEQQPSWDALKEDDELLECAPLLNNQGSLFALTEDEYTRILALAGENGGGDTPTDEYTIEDAMDGLFMDESKFVSIVDRLRAKHNIILQGPPGVGKTYIAERIAFALMEQKARKRVKMVQFHQSYSYEDFIMGFRPNSDGHFQLKKGVFYEFCETARADTSNEYVFIIDEINRGNLSKIMGEMMMLIEGDKRKPKYATPLTYHDPQTDSPFYVPENVYIIGMMNTADRSLAMVDYALRRRFSFVDVMPAFGASTAFERFLEDRCTSEDLVSHILGRFANLNRLIGDDASLGDGFAIGHSYFCPNNRSEEIDEDLYERIIDTEIAPLLREYWFDNTKAAGERIKNLYLS